MASGEPMNAATIIPAVRELLDLSGRTILVSGASGNIGRRIAIRLAEAGAAIVVHYHSNQAGAAITASSIEKSGGNAAVVQADLTSQDAVTGLFEDLQQQGRLVDGVVNNAATQPPAKTLQDLSAGEWRAVMAANLDSAFMVTRIGAQYMLGQGATGAIVNIASIAGSDPSIGHGQYATSKAGLIMLTRASALEYGPAGIRVNTVSPGLIDRDGLQDDWPEGVLRWQQHAPLQRLGQPDDVADAVLFLLSPASRWLSGVNLVVDGGMSSVSRW
jgi:NAD(P)-dependent dehydrogenase (short-subunit alcohol dehydrogenase family)